ncbi:hypothetical protein [Metabacillus schmidteae]|uniref:hypothetical protein n=1 Tax=Metabacillus schmidteae TaxID=2730405 RepID=UPI00158E72FD|nr:hypothetical protein [Metabacillus schmidteae]
MEKEKKIENVSLNGNRKEEHLEISSTGYGLESVTTSTEALVQGTEREFNQQ